MQKVVIFTFAGRKPYLEIQKHYVLELMRRYENLEYHLWNFSRNARDNAYLQELAASSPRIKLFNKYYEGDNPVVTCTKRVGVTCSCTKCRVGKWSQPYKYYAKIRKHWDDLFVKVDDDILFLEVDRFGEFLEGIRQFPDGILSATVVNNGLCAASEPTLRDAVVRTGLVQDVESPAEWWMLCTSVPFLELAHRHFLEEPGKLLGLPCGWHPLPRTRFSINTIGFTWPVMQAIAHRLKGETGMNDEHVISTGFDLRTMQGFVTSHLHYSDQRSGLPDEKEQELLAAYESLSSDYLRRSAA